MDIGIIYFLSALYPDMLMRSPSFSLPSLYFASGGGFKQVKTNRDKIISGIYTFKTQFFSNMTQVKMKKKSFSGKKRHQNCAENPRLVQRAHEQDREVAKPMAH